VLRCRIYGPTGDTYLRLALDTGATSTVVNTALLVAVGYDPGVAPDRVRITTGSGVEFAPRVTMQKFEAAGRARNDFPVLAHTLPPSASVDGLLGLDFLRNHRLTVDFRNGKVSLT